MARRWCTPARSTGRADGLRAALAAALLATAVAPARAADGSSALDRLAWLAGCWAAEKGEPGSGETWTAPAGGTMLGLGRTVRQGRTVEHEFLLIRLDAEGRAVYVARPSNQREASFVATQIDDGAVVFENPAHDFPQRIGYRRLPEGRLLARIDGQRNGAARAVEFPMRRTECP